MKKISLLLLLVLSVSAYGQKYITRTGTIEFFSETDVENIEAINNQVTSAIDANKGDVVFAVLMKAFAFEKALMQEHFNEKYVESDKFPKSKFRGTIEDFSVSELSDVPKEFTVKGKLTIHGVTQDIEVTEKFWLKDNDIIGECAFTIKLADYNIEVPAAVRENISKTIDIKVKMKYEKMD